MTGDQLSITMKTSPEAAQLFNRFVIVEASARQHKHPERKMNKISTQILDWIRSVTSNTVSEEYAPLRVSKMSEASQLFDQFHAEITDKTSIELGSIIISPWEHAYNQADKIATICACADNPIQPCVTEQHALWAIGFVKYCAKQFECRLTVESSHSVAALGTRVLH